MEAKMLNRKTEIFLQIALVFGLIQGYLLVLSTVFPSGPPAFVDEMSPAETFISILFAAGWLPFVIIVSVLVTRLYRHFRDKAFLSKVDKMIIETPLNAVQYVLKTRQAQPKLYWLYTLNVLLNAWAGNIALFQIGYTSLAYDPKLYQRKHYSCLVTTQAIVDILSDKQVQDARTYYSLSIGNERLAEALCHVIPLYRAENYALLVQEEAALNQISIPFFRYAADYVLWRSYLALGDKANVEKYQQRLRDHPISAELSQIMEEQFAKYVD
jgi:hypothetical protein